MTLPSATLLIAALSCTGATAAAQTASSSSPSTSAVAPASTASAAPQPLASVSVTGKAMLKERYHLAPQEFNDYDYQYTLDNGQYIRMSRRVNRYYAQVKNEAPVEVFGQKPGLFKSENGLELAFSNDGEDVVVTGLDKMPGGQPPTAAR